MSKQPRPYQIECEAAAVRTACGGPVKPRGSDKASAELRRLREWIARARSQAVLVELPAGKVVVVPEWFMRDE